MKDLNDGNLRHADNLMQIATELHHMRRNYGNKVHEHLGSHYLASSFFILNPCLLLNGPHALFIAHTRAQCSAVVKAWQPYISRDDLLLQLARLHRDLLCSSRSPE